MSGYWFEFGTEGMRSLVDEGLEQMILCLASNKIMKKRGYFKNTAET